MKILVTGGFGFIGRKLCTELLKDRHNHLIIIDDLSSSTLENLENRAILNDPNLLLFIDESTQDIDITGLEHQKLDVIFHLGEFSRIVKSFDLIDQTFASNQRGTYNILKIWKANKCKLIYAGISSKFGNGEADQHLSPYSWTKAKNVELIKNFADWFGLRFNIAYFYNVYGEGHISEGDFKTVIAIKDYVENFKSQVS